MFRHPLFALLWILLVVCLAGCDRRSVSYSELASSVSNPVPENFYQLMNQGKNYLDQGDTENALKVYGEAQQLVPNDPDVYLNLANSLAGKGRLEQAVNNYKMELDRAPTDSYANANIGATYYRLGEYGLAYEHTLQALKYEPGMPEANNNKIFLERILRAKKDQLPSN